MENTQNKIHKLTNDNGVIIEFISQGGKITAAKIPDKDEFVDIIIGYDTIEEILNGDAYFGAICGRVANRISNSTFSINGNEYKLKPNEGKNQLHGGANGFNTKLWEVNPINKNGYTSAYKLSLLSPDGDENYPGNLQVDIIYALNNKNEFLIDIEATTDKATVVNLTSHPYFNLKGAGNGNILEHILEVNANQFTPTDNNSITTGEIWEVKNTDMDFTVPKQIENVTQSNYLPIKALKGLDHNFVINKKENELAFACRLIEPESNRSIEVFTTQPGLQVYTGMHFDGVEKGKGGTPFVPYCAIAIEAQNFPDALNKANFPNCVLNTNETYIEKIIYKFNF